MSLEPVSLNDLRPRAIIPIEGKTCAFLGCDQPPTAAEPKEHGGKLGVHWYCKQHRKAAPEGATFEIGPVCGAPAETHEAPCGGAATYLLIADVKGVGLRVVPLCKRHATPFVEAATRRVD